jgi:hypothetical protein
MKLRKRSQPAEKEPPKMRLMKIPIKWGKTIEFREVWMNANHMKFER